MPSDLTTHPHPNPYVDPYSDPYIDPWRAPWPRRLVWALTSRMAARAPRLQAPRSEKALRDIKRLVLRAPQALPALGFAHDPHASTPITTYWRKGDIVVRVWRTQRAVQVTREDP